MTELKKLKILFAITFLPIAIIRLPVVIICTMVAFIENFICDPLFRANHKFCDWWVELTEPPDTYIANKFLDRARTIQREKSQSRYVKIMKGNTKEK